MDAPTTASGPELGGAAEPATTAQETDHQPETQHLSTCTVANQEAQSALRRATDSTPIREKSAKITPRPVSVFLSYSHRDERLASKLDEQLAPLRKSGQISLWRDRQITPGARFVEETESHFLSSDIVLLLISPHYLESNYCHRVEIPRAFERHIKGLARVVPVILRPCAWHSTPIGRLQALPKDAKPVTTWQLVDEALLDVANGVRKVVMELAEKSLTPRIKQYNLDKAKFAKKKN
ncbi:MAG: toll/interleukin-1 receptor domain-containing protein [Terracidiphilus sp.]